MVYKTDDGNLQVMLNKKNEEKKNIASSGNISKPNKKLVATAIQEVEHIKIKTLAEIRAERNAKLDKLNQENEEAEVTSTSKEETPIKEEMQVDEPEQQVAFPSSSMSPVVRKIRLRRKLPVSENVMSSSTNNRNSGNSNDTTQETRLKSVKDTNAANNIKHSEHHVEEKILDDVLLLEEDDDDYDITLKAEEDLLNDIDDED